MPEEAKRLSGPEHTSPMGHSHLSLTVKYLSIIFFKKIRTLQIKLKSHSPFQSPLNLF